MLRWLTAGESHGPSLVAVLEGLPAHVEVTSKDIADALARRRLGYGRGARMKFEQDQVRIIGGIRHGESQGGPVAIEVGNTEWPKWEKVMAADPVDPVELEGLARNEALTRPRPGHADLVGMQKYGFDDARPILERASARETAARVALGARMSWISNGLMSVRRSWRLRGQRRDRDVLRVVFLCDVFLRGVLREVLFVFFAGVFRVVFLPALFFDAAFFRVLLFFLAPPPSCLLTVAHARFCAVFFDTPRCS